MRLATASIVRAGLSPRKFSGSQRVGRVDPERGSMPHIGGDRNVREQFRSHEWFGRTEEFCARYDGPAFNPSGETLPLAFFEPMLRRVFAQPRRSLYARVSQAR